MIFKILLSRSVQTPNSDQNWQTSCPLQTFVCNISRHLEFIIEQGHRVNWVSTKCDPQFYVCRVCCERSLTVRPSVFFSHATIKHLNGFGLHACMGYTIELLQSSLKGISLRRKLRTTCYCILPDILFHFSVYGFILHHLLTMHRCGLLLQTS